ncbi:MAG TPA: Arc family DNA-binding protein [Ktedonobacterales bacterium]|nr:Arc family DNA-binding protein [Ktedonobacterales bacterium]
MLPQAGLTFRLFLWYNTGMNTEERQQQKMTFVLPRTLMERLRLLSKQHHRSLTGELLVAIETYLKQQEQPHD